MRDERKVVVTGNGPFVAALAKWTSDGEALASQELKADGIF